jgi:hypothetical protein
MPRSFHEPRDGDFEGFDLFDRQAEEERKARLADAIKRNELVAAQEAAAEAARAERSRKFSLETAGKMRAREYQAAGVQPLTLGPDGYPPASLSFLKSIGWTIQVVDGMKELVRPHHFAPPSTGKRSNDEGT